MTILGAMSLSGMVATMTIEEPTDTDIFLAYVEHLLYPVLKPGDVVVMDNPQLYLTQLQVHLPSTTISQLHAWLPDQWKQRHTEPLKNTI